MTHLLTFLGLFFQKGFAGPFTQAIFPDFHTIIIGIFISFGILYSCDRIFVDNSLNILVAKLKCL